jgi:hypothetical protein
MEPLRISWQKGKININNTGEVPMRHSFIGKLAAGLFLLVSFSAGYGLTIFQDSFDQASASLECWKKAGATATTRYTGTYKFGTASMQLSSTNEAITYVNTSIFTNMTLTFKMAGVSIPSGSAVEAWVDSGAGFVLVASLPSASANGAFVTYTKTIPAAASLKIKFRTSSTSTAAHGYIDDVLLNGNRK